MNDAAETFSFVSSVGLIVVVLAILAADVAISHRRGRRRR